MCGFANRGGDSRHHPVSEDVWTPALAVRSAAYFEDPNPSATAG